MNKGRKVKKGISFNFFKAHKKIATLLIISIGFLGFFFASNYGRYVIDVIEVYYLRSQNFYFSSDKLTIDNKKYEINPWSGTTSYDINISMSSLLNSIKGTTENITYDLTCEGDSKVDCYFGQLGVNSTSRTISTDTHSDNFVVTVHAKSNDILFANGEKVSVKVKATSTAPYKEELSAVFELVIGDYGLNFEIEDEPGSVYFDALITNTYDTESSEIVLTIKNAYIDDVIFDMTNPIMQQDSFDYEVTAINGDDFITEVSFIIEPKSSLMVKYYKTDSTKDYSYVLGDTSIDSVISFVANDVD